MSSTARRRAAAYAMDSLKRSMRWDEQAFGREYDLDIFMIVAVSDFNMGAMENKGLNVFNDKYVLASPQTATDRDFAGIEAIIAHEYFHNWTGNRITCRDWFQLCLKEGLTVFRDQEFTADMRSRPVERSATCATCVRIIRGRRPSRSPIRCSRSSITRSTISTRRRIYEGREVVRRSCALLGASDFRKGRICTSNAATTKQATVHQFVQFSRMCERDLHQFMLWASQAGTPEVIADGKYDAQANLHGEPVAIARSHSGPAGEGADGDPAACRAGRRGRCRSAIAGRRQAHARAT